MLVVLSLFACTSSLTTAPEPPAPLPLRLVLNEVVARNDSLLPDDRGDYVDWVELYNAGAAEVDLSEFMLTDGVVEWTGEGTVGAGRRELLWADGSGREGATTFTLDPGEELVLYHQGEEVDHVVIPEDLLADTSWGRFPDGGEEWRASARPTPDRTNGARPPAFEDPSDWLFQDQAVLDFELTLDDQSLRNLADDPRTETLAGFAFEETWFPEVAARLKGGWGSTRTIDQKTGFKFDLNEFADHRFRGLETVTVNNMVQDPSYIHESLAYELFRAAGVPAPRTGWVRLWLNGELFGLMLHVETVDDRFTSRWWADGDGYLYEGAYGSDFTVGNEYSFELDEGPGDDYSAITDVINLASGPATDEAIAALETRFDLDNLLTVMAVESVSLHWDGYTTRNNYRVYLDPGTNRFQMIPWGTDQTFHDIWYGPYAGQGHLFQFCLANAGCKARYDAELRRVAVLIGTLPLKDRLLARAAWLRPDIEADPRKEFGIETHDAIVSDTAYILDYWPAQMLTEVPPAP